MNTKMLLVVFAIVATAMTFVITSMAGVDLSNGIGATEAFAQNMTNMTGGNMTNMTG
jgi:hypothetical protein